MALLYKMKCTIGEKSYDFVLPIISVNTLPEVGTYKVSGNYLDSGIEWLKQYMSEEELTYIGSAFWTPLSSSTEYNYSDVKHYFPFTQDLGTIDISGNNNFTSLFFNVNPDIVMKGTRNSSQSGLEYTPWITSNDNYGVNHTDVDCFYLAFSSSKTIALAIIVCNSFDYVKEDTEFRIIRTPSVNPKNGNYYNPNFLVYDDYATSFKLDLRDILLNKKPDMLTDDDPYQPGGETGEGGGTGDFDNTSDEIDFPPLPSLSATNTGFITLYNPSTSQLWNLASYMWGDLFDVTTWKKIFADPMDAILGLSIVPVAVPDGGNHEITVGNIPTGISMNRAASQYVSVDCGSLNVNEFWGAYLDYEPYTKAELYLPYVGTHPISVDDIMNKNVHIVYHVDILSGACCAYVKCGASVLYSFVGQCSCSIPITGNDWTNVINGTLSIAAAIGSMVATGGATAPMAASTIASAAVNSMKPSVEKSGSLGGAGGMLGIQTPYLILTRPRQALPKNQNMFTGYPSYITTVLSECKGYTEVASIHLENIPATDEEINEIENILKTGVIL